MEIKKVKIHKTTLAVLLGIILGIFPFFALAQGTVSITPNTVDTTNSCQNQIFEFHAHLDGGYQYLLFNSSDDYSSNSDPFGNGPDPFDEDITGHLQDISVYGCLPGTDYKAILYHGSFPPSSSYAEAQTDPNTVADFGKVLTFCNGVCPKGAGSDFTALPTNFIMGVGDEIGNGLLDLGILLAGLISLGVLMHYVRMQIKK